MAIDDHSAISNPRISFSYNLSQFDKAHSGKLSSHSGSSNLIEDFEFPSPDSYAVMKSLYADELFIGGRILTAAEVKKQPEPPAMEPQRSSESSVVMKQIDAIQSNKELGSKDSFRVKKKGCSRRIKRSNSLSTWNSSCKPRLCFLPLVSRRGSTGSAPPRSRTGPGRLDWRSRVSPVTTIPSKDVFGLSTLFMSRRTRSMK